jgi:hypothetical protein
MGDAGRCLPAQRRIRQAGNRRRLGRSGVWNKPKPQNGNIDRLGDLNAYDLESTVLHALGHALGLTHPNDADRATDANGGRNRRSPVHDFGPDGIDDMRAGPDNLWGTADDVLGNDTLLNISLDRENSPYKPANVVDSIVRSGMVPTREQAGARGFPDTEAVMVHGIFCGESQQLLGYDDMHGLMAVETGPDFLSHDNATRVDDFIYHLVQSATAARLAADRPTRRTATRRARLGDANPALDARHLA